MPNGPFCTESLPYPGVRNATTNEDGRYVFAMILHGHYSLAGSKESFATVRASGFEHTVNEAATRNFHLAVRTTTAAATVQSSAVSLATFQYPQPPALCAGWASRRHAWRAAAGIPPCPCGPARSHEGLCSCSLHGLTTNKGATQV
jgi:hypothetical protein